MPYSHCLTLEIEYEAQLLDQWIMCAILSVSTYMLTFVDSEGQAFLLIYSITSKSSFDRIDIYRQAVLRVKGPKPIIALVGNKSDKTAEREVSKGDGAALARSFGCIFEETSAMTAQNVEHIFTCLVRNMRDTNTQDTKPSEEKKKKPQRKCHTF